MLRKFKKKWMRKIKKRIKSIFLSKKYLPSVIEKEKLLDSSEEKKVSSLLSVQEKGSCAQQIKGNLLWNEIFDSIDKEISNCWKQTNIGDKEIRELLFFRNEALRKIKFEIDKYIQNAIYEREKYQDL